METSAAVVRKAVRKLGGAELDSGEFLHEISTRIRRVAPCDACGWMTLDPDTLLPSGTLETEKSPELLRALWRNELLTSGVVAKLPDYARRATPVAASSQLDAATAADSPRIQLIHRHTGIGDDLRANLRVGRASWGHFALSRELGARNFDDSERAFVADDLDTLLAQLEQITRDDLHTLRLRTAAAW